MKRFLISLLTVCFSVFVAAASLGVHPQCASFILYQPEVPACLRK
jgi:cyclic lactone autoinducer peptide